MKNLKEAHEKLNSALNTIDEACDLLVWENGEVHKPKIKKLGMAIAEILHTQKLIRDDDSTIQK